MSRPTTMQVDIEALQHNFNQVRKLAPKSYILAMIKANAYGHGLIRTAKALANADAFGVACIETASMLRTAGITKPIVLMAGFFSEKELLEVANLDCEIVVHQHEQIVYLENVQLPKPLKVWCKINIGLNRLGFHPKIIKEIYQRLQHCNNVVKDPCLIAHFSDSSNLQGKITSKQLKTFIECTKDLPGKKSLANSSSIIALPESHFDWVRPGIILYGVSPIFGLSGSSHNLKNVMSLYSQLIAIRRQQKGEMIGYGGSWNCPEDMFIGIAAIGYGDGYPYHASNGTPVLVNGIRCSIVGKVSMDMIAIDLRPVPDAKIGDLIALWGDGLPIEEIAKASNTIPYELLTNVCSRVHGYE